jgi:hypothetical protein
MLSLAFVCVHACLPACRLRIEQFITFTQFSLSIGTQTARTHAVAAPYAGRPSIGPHALR